MMPNQADRVWLLPPKFWSATKEMPAEEIEGLMEFLMDFLRRATSNPWRSLISLLSETLHNNAA